MLASRNCPSGRQVLVTFQISPVPSWLPLWLPLDRVTFAPLYSFGSQPSRQEVCSAQVTLSK